MALELIIVLSQALTALRLFRLFRSVDGFAAGATAAFGLVNATAVLVSAAFLVAASDVVLGPAVAGGDAARTPLLLFQLSGRVLALRPTFTAILPMCRTHLAPVLHRGHIEDNMRTISLSVSESDYEAFRKAAEADGRSIALMIREAMSAYRAQVLEPRTTLTSLPVLVGHRLIAPLPTRDDIYAEVSAGR